MTRTEDVDCLLLPRVPSRLLRKVSLQNTQPPILFVHTTGLLDGTARDTGMMQVNLRSLHE
jgi:hypothetical protein